MQRFGWVIGLRPEHRHEYLTLHADVWPDVEAMLTRANIRNYTIFVHGNLLFSYYEYCGIDHDADLARIAADPQTQRWWALTDPCQDRLAGAPDGMQWTPMAQVWHLA
ncbi:MAG TPA: L-rhamnose mutarotase [Acidothermaceae bacterium]